MAASTLAQRPPAMPFIMITVLIDMMSIGLIVPVLPALVGAFTSSQSEQAWWYGAVTFAFSLANFIASPILGALSDRFGRRPVLLLGFCGLAISFFVTAMATAIWVLIAVRVLSGAMQATAPVANAYVADITEPEGRARRFGLLGAMFGLGFILGPVMGGLRASMHYCGCASIAEMHEKASFVEITSSGVRESHVHDVQITKEAPNYRAE